MENQTAHTQHAALQPWKKGILTSALSLIIILSLVGNLIVIIVFSSYKPLRKIANTFMVSLAASDMLIGGMDMPAWIMNAVWEVTSSQVVRDLWICLDIVTGVGSILNLTAVSVCRYIQITKPYTYTEIVTKGRVIVSLFAIWLFAGFMAVLKIFIPRDVDLWYYRPGYQVLVVSVSFFLPLTGISYCYYGMFNVSRQQNQQPSCQSAQLGHRYALDIKAIKTIAIVIVMFVICWCPFFVLVLVNGFCSCITNDYLITFVKIMHYSNSALNPIIYVWHNTQYRKAFIKALVKFTHKHDVDFVVAFLNGNAKNSRRRRAKQIKKSCSVEVLSPRLQKNDQLTH